MATSKSSAKSKSTSKADVRNIIKINLEERKRRKRRKSYRPKRKEEQSVRQPTVVYTTPFTPTYLNTGFRQPSYETLKLHGDIENRQLLSNISDRLGKIESSGDMLRLMAFEGEPRMPSLPPPKPEPKSERPVPKSSPPQPKALKTQKAEMIDFLLRNKDEIDAKRKTPYRKSELETMSDTRLQGLYSKTYEKVMTGLIETGDPRVQELVEDKDGKLKVAFMTPPGGMAEGRAGGGRN